jgi:RHS repeat-associated protein
MQTLVTLALIVRNEEAKLRACLESIAGITYSYDNDGNMIGRTRTSNNQVTTYTYDFRNRLTEVLIKTSGGVTVQDDKFTYDVENRRIGKNTLSGGQSWTGYDGVNPYADFNSSGSLTYRYLYGNAIDFLFGRVDTSGNAMWYLRDNIGSVRENVNASGTVLDSITYDSYGNILTESSSSNGDRFKFTSREWDSEIGQYYYRARYYGPAIGRFQSEDPSGFASAELNLYRFVQNSPPNLSDPLGLASTKVRISKFLGTKEAEIIKEIIFENFPMGKDRSIKGVVTWLEKNALHLLNLSEVWLLLTLYLVQQKGITVRVGAKDKHDPGKECTFIGDDMLPLVVDGQTEGKFELKALGGFNILPQLLKLGWDVSFTLGGGQSTDNTKHPPERTVFLEMKLHFTVSAYDATRKFEIGPIKLICGVEDMG